MYYGSTIYNLLMTMHPAGLMACGVVGVYIVYKLGDFLARRW